MYYYMLKVLDVYPSPANLIMIMNISAIDLSGNNISNLSFVSVDCYEYGENGTGVFKNIEPRWQTDRGLSFPHYLIFSSPSKISSISILSNGGAFVPEHCELYCSIISLTSFTDTKWGNPIISFTMPNQSSLFTIDIIKYKYLIQDGNNLCNTNGDILSIIGSVPYELNYFNNYGILYTNTIDSNVTSKIINKKYNIAMLK